MAHDLDDIVDGPLTSNKLSGDNTTFVTSVGDWTSTNSNLVPDFDFHKYDNINSLKITPTAYDPIVLSLNGTNTSLRESNDNIDLHFWMWSTNDVLVTVDLSLGSEASSTISQTYAGGIWNVVRANPVDVPLSSETYPIGITITLTNHGGGTVWLSNPVLYQEYKFTRNRFVRETVPLIPRIFTELDKIQTRPTFPMYRMMEIGLAYAGVGFEQQEHFRYRDVAGGRKSTDPETLSGLVDPTVADVAFLPWLSQFTGTQYIDPTIRTTPWGNLPATWQQVMQDIDEAVDIVLNVTSLTRTSNVVSAVLDGDVTDYAIGQTVLVSGAGTFDGQFLITGQDIGTSTIEWSQDGSDDTILTGTVSLIDQSWIELEAFRIDITNRVEFLRWQVENQYYGVRAGTLEALAEATKFYLTDTKTVNIFPKHQGVPFLIKIFTKTSETPGGVDGEESLELVQALQAAKPAGFKIVHECNSDGTDSLFVLGSSTEGLLSSSLL